MAIQFSDTNLKNGLVQFLETELGKDYGYISGNTDRLKDATNRFNIALDNYLLLWAKSAGTWQGGDINFTTYPIITDDLVSGQRDYTFDTDDGGNKITSISKVLILPSATATEYEEIIPIDELNTETSGILTDTNTGVPYQYGKLSNGIFLDPIPSYSVTDGIKMVVETEGSHFVYTDTTKVAGIPVYHEYLYKKVAHEIAKKDNLSNVGQLEKDVIDFEGSERLGVTGKITDFFSKREKDVRKSITFKKINFI